LAIILSILFLASIIAIPVSAAAGATATCTRTPYTTLADAAGGNNILMYPTFVDGGTGWQDYESAPSLVDYSAIDTDTDSKYGSPDLPYWCQWMYDKAYTVNNLILRTANDSDQYFRRMGDGWTLSGSTDGKTWNVIYTGKETDVDNTAFTYYTIDLPDNKTPYQYYKFDAEAQSSDNAGGIQLCDAVLTVDKSVAVPSAPVYIYIPKQLSISSVGTSTIEATDFDAGAANYGVATQAGSSHDVRPDEAVATQWCGDTYIGRDGVDGTKIGNIGWISAGDWVQYTVNVAADGDYDVSTWISSGADPAGSVTVSYDGKAIGTGASTNSGWQTYDDVKVGTVSMTKGSHVIRVDFPDGNINLQALEFAKAVPATTEAPATTAAPATTVAAAANDANATTAAGDTTAAATTAVADNGSSNVAIIIIIIVVVIIVIVVIIILVTRKKPTDNKPEDKKPNDKPANKK